MGLALGFLLPLRVRGRLRRGVAMLSCGAVLVAAGLGSISAAQAQAFTWGDVGSTTNTTDYNLGTNWGNPPVGAPPVAAGQSAIFDATGSNAITVTTGADESASRPRARKRRSPRERRPCGHAAPCLD